MGITLVRVAQLHLYLSRLKVVGGSVRKFEVSECGESGRGCKDVHWHLDQRVRECLCLSEE